MAEGDNTGHDENEVPLPPPDGLALDFPAALALLASAEMAVQGLLPLSSNYTFLVLLTDERRRTLGVYKPQAGERPLWDFPRGTLFLREQATFLVSEALGWHLVPPTVLRDGPHGPGMVQLYVSPDPDVHYFTLRGQFASEFRRVAALDLITNNADRKAGHILQDAAGQIWIVDHGLTFHEEHKLRTVIWDFAGQPIPAEIRDDLARLDEQMDDGPLAEALAQLLSTPEIRAFRRRVRQLLRKGHFPHPGAGRHVPWPPI